MSAHHLGFDDVRLRRIDDLCHSYVDAGRLPCAVVQVARAGVVVHHHAEGWADVDDELPIADDSIFRIYSMTKPVTSLALMQLVERGLVMLEHPVAKFLPEFADMQVWDGRPGPELGTRPATTIMRVRDVLTHTSGLTYGFHYQNDVDARYRDLDLGQFGGYPDYDLTQACELLGSLPLLFDPGTAWNYGMSTDVCGRLVEAISGQPFDEYLDEQVLEPLGMVDTGWSVPDDQIDRLTTNYLPTREKGLAVFDKGRRPGRGYGRPPKFVNPGGGLVSTLADYQRFCDMLVGGGALDGTRIIGARTLEYMTANHLPGGKLLNELGQSTFSESAMEGTGFGLGFSTIVDAAAAGTPKSAGTFAWGGAATTRFWVDPVEEITVIFLTQLLPSSTYPVTRQLEWAVYGALTETRG